MSGYSSLMQSNDFMMRQTERKLEKEKRTLKFGAGKIYCDGQLVTETRELRLVIADDESND